ncbi:MAG: RNA polymerase sigma-70 factor [Cytophagaceae bacterium]|jgi:RNA polymerase sigma-70 factor (ECF subfamily)|nr:RNA polymerase sigma-70 factor [Cytophagaceae bacterium]
MHENSNINGEFLLYNRLRNGEERAFKQLYDEHYRRLAVFANTILSDSDLARSVVQDVFVTLYEKREEINIHTSLKSHLFQSVRNRCLNILKHDKITRIHHQRILDNSSKIEKPFETLEYNELEKLITDVINSLPEQCKRIFRMSRYDNLSNQEIADHLVLSKRTVETQISKALKRLKEELLKSGLLEHTWIMTLLLIFFLDTF